MGSLLTPPRPGLYRRSCAAVKHTNIQKKTSRLSNYGLHVGLWISQLMTKVVMQNVTNRSPVTSGDDLLASDVFSYSPQVCSPTLGALSHMMAEQAET